MSILPLQDPMITMFPAYAATCGILQNDSKTFDWLFSQYIQLFVYNDKDRSFDSQSIRGSFFLDHDNREYCYLWQSHAFIRHRWCPFLEVYNMPSEMIMHKEDTFVGMLERCIDSGFYIYLELVYDPINAFIPLQTSQKHELLIFGYDRDKKLLHVADYYFRGVRRYHRGVCAYDDIEKAGKLSLQKFGKMNHEISLIKYDDRMEYKLNFEHIRSQVLSYLEPEQQTEDSFKQYIGDRLHIAHPSTSVGINVYNYLAEFIQEETERGKNYIDFRMYHGMYEHKLVMMKRIKYLYEKGYISECKFIDFTDKYETLIRDTLVIRNSILKYNVTHQVDILKRIQNQIAKTRSDEDRVLRNVFSL